MQVIWGDLVTQGHLQCHHSIELVQFIFTFHKNCLYCTMFEIQQIICWKP